MSFDTREVTGFAVAGADKKFVPAQAEIVERTADDKPIGVANRNQVVVWSDAVSDPVAVRYAWADNPVCNLQTVLGLPANPFRTDDWPGVTVNNVK